MPSHNDKFDTAYVSLSEFNTLESNKTIEIKILDNDIGNSKIIFVEVPSQEVTDNDIRQRVFLPTKRMKVTVEKKNTNTYTLKKKK